MVSTPSDWNATASVIAFMAGVLLWCSLSPTITWQQGRSESLDWDVRRDMVKEAFLTSWRPYVQHAWGSDEYHPISQTDHDSADALGWIIVDSLDTMMLMNLTNEVAEARKWIHRKLNYNQDRDMNTFETTIRMLGGLLSAHYLSTQLPDVASSRDFTYLQKAIDLGDRLLGAFESPSGIPYAMVNLANRNGVRAGADGGASSTAEATTLQLEMRYLAHLTGNEFYWRKAEKVMEAIDANNAEAGLVPIFVDPDSGRFVTRQIRLGSRGDSYYEYLIKQYLQTLETEPIYLSMWEEALQGIQDHLITTSQHSLLRFVAELPHGIEGDLLPKMDHLVCYLPGTIALGATGGLNLSSARKLPTWTKEKEAHIELARELTKTCWGMYAVTATGLAPEIAFFETEPDMLRGRPDWKSKPCSKDAAKGWKKDYIIKPADAHNLQRPETVESLFMMWRITQDPIYRDWGWQIFRSFQEFSLLPDGEGYTSLDNVNTVPPPRRDNMESFWLAETLKYLYLLFSPTEYIPLTDVIFNTEAHIFPRFTPKKQFRTGWARNRTT